MKKSLKAFMSDMIDYAGLFPPAELSLDKAIYNYAAYREGAESWMLSRFIIPASKLERLDSYGEELFSEEQPFAFSVLGGGTRTVSEFEEEVEAASEACSSFRSRHGQRVTTEVLEMKLPREAALSGDAELVAGLLDKAVDTLTAAPSGVRALFVEGLFEESWKKDMEAVAGGISAHNGRECPEPYLGTGYKLRCGGVEAHMFPSAEQVAFTLNRARKHDVPVKCTAGLHHPVRHYSAEVQARMHGFLNVFGGAMLAYAHDFSDDELLQVLSEEDPDHFVFTDQSFSWKDYSVPTETIRELREVALISYGSCSFDEPREDLQGLGLL